MQCKRTTLFDQNGPFKFEIDDEKRFIWTGAELKKPYGAVLRPPRALNGRHVKTHAHTDGALFFTNSR